MEGGGGGLSRRHYGGRGAAAVLSRVGLIVAHADSAGQKRALGAEERGGGGGVR